MMKAPSIVTVGLVALAVIVAGCSSGTGGSLNPLASSGAPANNDPSGTYSVLVALFNNPDSHIQDAQFYKSTLEKTQGWQGLHIVSQADHSEMYWGRFRTIEAAKPTLQRVKAYRAQNGAQLFAQAIIVPLPGTNFGPREWDLKNAPGEYSLLVAVFENDPKSDPPYMQCDKDAVDYCTQLRQQGYEAYYHHGPNKSSVTIGSFGTNAVRVEKKEAFQFGQANPTVMENLVVIDPKLLALQKKFPKLAYNGRELINVKKDREGNVISRTVAETYVVKVPHDNERATANDNPGHRQPR